MAKGNAASALCLLARRSEAIRVSIVDLGSIELLVVLLRDSERDARADAADALKELATNDTNRLAIMNAGGVWPLVALSRDYDEIVYKREIAVGALRNLAETDAVREQITNYSNEFDHLHDSDDVQSDVDEPVQSASRDRAAEVLGLIDEHARHVIPEGVYLKIADALQKWHDEA